MIRGSLVSLVVLAGAAAGCADTGVVLSPTSFYGAYTPTVLNYSATSGGMLVEVVGNPFDVPKSDLERSITGSMSGYQYGPHVNFITTPGEGFRSPYRIVLVFDPTRGYTESKLCRDSGTIQPGTGDVVKVHAALCAGDQPLTGVSGQVAKVTGPDDPRFRRLISQIAMNLLPPTNPDHRNNDNGIFL